MKAKVILFKRNGKFYCEEEWEVPEEVPIGVDGSTRFRPVNTKRPPE